MEHHASPTATGELGYSLEVFNAVGQKLAIVTLAESRLEALRPDELLSVRSPSLHAA